MQKESPFMAAKRERMQTIMRLCDKLCPIASKKLVAMIEIQFGVKRETAVGYVSTLVRAEYIRRDKKLVLHLIKSEKPLVKEKD